jgi:hypothetical protein
MNPTLRESLIGGAISGALFAYPVLMMALANSGQARATSVVAAVAAAAAAGVLLFAILRRIRESVEAATIVAASIAGLFYIYGPAHAWIEIALLEYLTLRGENVFLSLVVRYLNVLLSVGIASVIWIIMARLHRASQKTLQQAFRGLGIMSIALAGMLAIQTVARAPQMHRTAERPDVADLRATLEEAPDIYVIIMDGYARADVLRHYYNFDNTVFLAALRKRGFFIADRSTSNYHNTFLSLASMLNLDYVHNVLDGRISPDQTDRGAAYRAIRHSEVHRLLRSNGYRTVHFQSTWGATLENPYADVEVPCTATIFQDEFFRALVEASWLKVFQSRAAADLAGCYQSNLDKLHLYTGAERPSFVLAHFLPPHHPYLFDENGNVLRSATIANQFEYQKRLWEERDLYLGQLKFMNRNILGAIDRILKGSDRRPVIVVMSDHGPNISEGLSAGEITQVRFSNFIAVMTPDSVRAPIPNDVALVNLFRYILPAYVETPMDALPVEYYESPFARPYDLRRVLLH